MSGKMAKDLRAAAKLAQGPAESNRAKKMIPLVVSFFLLAVVGLVAYVAFFRAAPSVSLAAKASTPAHALRTVKTLDDLLKMPAEELGDVDIATMNLLCATGLPGSENLDIGRCLARLDEWAAIVKHETERHLYRAHDPKWADHFKHSESWLRAEMLAQILQEDCGVHYNMERIRNVDFTKSKDLFIHGMIDDPNGGTCASMPVLYVAVGRRLGYPIKLVQTKSHVFVRWDDGKERFNIETTNQGATESYPDDYYRTWPETWTAAEVKTSRYMIPLSPAEELASFLGDRGHCLLDNGHAKEALEVYAAGHKLAPLDPVYLAWMQSAEVRLRPQPGIGGPGYRLPRRGPNIYETGTTEVNRINAMNQMSRQRPQPGLPNGNQPNQPPGPGQPPG